MTSKKLIEARQVTKHALDLTTKRRAIMGGRTPVLDREGAIEFADIIEEYLKSEDRLKIIAVNGVATEEMEHAIREGWTEVSTQLASAMLMVAL